MTTGVRRPGDPIPPQVVKELRVKAGLTQDAFAHSLGVRGGKSVVSGWETGATVCDGPVAEFMRLKYGGVSASAEELMASMENLWNAGPSPVGVWRQVSAVPKVPLKMDTASFTNLFPNAAIEPGKFMHGFPFVSVLNSPDVFGRTSNGWVGRIPSVLEKSAHYLWIARRDGSFSYREPVWEDQQIDGGHLHIRSVMVLACATAAFIPKFAAQAGIDDSVEYDLVFDIKGMRGRGLVMPVDGVPIAYGINNKPERVWADERLHVEASATVAEMKRDVVSVSLCLVGELALLLSPSLSKRKLMGLLREFYEDDKKRGPYRNLGVLEGFL